MTRMAIVSWSRFTLRSQNMVIWWSGLSCTSSIGRRTLLRRRMLFLPSSKHGPDKRPSRVHQYHENTHPPHLTKVGVSKPKARCSPDDVTPEQATCNCICTTASSHCPSLPNTSTFASFPRKITVLLTHSPSLHVYIMPPSTKDRILEVLRGPLVTAVWQSLFVSIASNIIGQIVDCWQRDVRLEPDAVHLRC